ncbi:MAG TPA: SGNH/GDSL hydrolase family protein [Verrucomicrobiae bacterium]|nr:SGNH/GDSL hydrolase family protein [Verrucomicrobiae bacterium]
MKTKRFLGSAWLVLAISCGGLAVSPTARAQPATNAPAVTNRFESEIVAFERGDRTNPPPKNAILFTGSSSIRFWKNVPQEFFPAAAFARGFGGSQMSDLLFYVDRIVIPYAPKQVFVYEGDNDLAAGKTPEEILAGYQQFVERVHHELPRTRIAFIAVKPSQARWKNLEKIKATNALIEDYSKTDPRLEFIDVFSPMLDTNGSMRQELLGPDGLHMNPEGYKLWGQVIRPHVMRPRMD